MLLLVADAHSPKNQLLLDGVQSVVGKKLPVTGGSVNKNAGQNWVYYQGRLYTDGAIAVAIRGDFSVSQAGRQAKVNDEVISTAKDASAKAKAGVKGQPVVMLAFDCAGRKGKLNNVADELSAVQDSIGRSLPLFGCYCAGEFGPTDTGESMDPNQCFGKGWHVMVSVLGR
jgi:hypothetical protein